MELCHNMLYLNQQLNYRYRMGYYY